jgi:SAM-dependent methyltransferase
MNKSLLVKLFGFPATLVHGDTLVLDRWRWLKQRLPKTRDGGRVMDVGCGTGSFTLGAAHRGYKSLGLSWDERNQATAQERAAMCKLTAATFEVLDVRRLDERSDLKASFDIVINCENIEHIIDDRKLMRDIADCLKPGGRLLLTTPYWHYRPMMEVDEGPFSRVEDGGHVRRGYSRAMLQELCEQSGLIVEEISFCSGYLSQRITKVLRTLCEVNPMLGWLMVLPLRVLPPLLDGPVTSLLRWPQFSICLEAYKPRFKPT